MDEAQRALFHIALPMKGAGRKDLSRPTTSSALGRSLPQSLVATQDYAVTARRQAHFHIRSCACHRPYRCRSIPGLAAPAAGVLVFLDDKDSFLAEQDDVFVAEHGSSAASAAGCR